MPRLDPVFKAVSSLTELDDGHSNTAAYNFCHVAAIYQLYMQDSTIVEESNDVRLRRSKILTNLLGRIVAKGLSADKVWSYSNSLNANVYDDRKPFAVQQVHAGPLLDVRHLGTLR